MTYVHQACNMSGSTASNATFNNISVTLGDQFYWWRKRSTWRKPPTWQNYTI